MCNHSHEMEHQGDAARSDFGSYVAGWRRRWEEERKADAAAAERARAIAEQLARILVDRFGVQRVVLVGSLARGEFRTDSDIDLAAQGLPDDALFRAGADLERAAEGFQVDLVPIESAGPAFLAHLDEEGIVLHG